MEDKIKLVKTFNPVMGCDIGCSYCYARKINQRFKHIPDFNVLMFQHLWNNAFRSFIKASHELC